MSSALCAIGSEWIKDSFSLFFDELLDPLLKLNIYYGEVWKFCESRRGNGIDAVFLDLFGRFFATNYHSICITQKILFYSCNNSDQNKWQCSFIQEEYGNFMDDQSAIFYLWFSSHLDSIQYYFYSLARNVLDFIIHSFN